MSAQIPLSVAIITYNEEENLPRCLASLPAGVELVVVDSGSSDNTENIVRQYGGSWVEHAFDDYAQQKNRAIAACTREWVLSLDADEELDELLRVSLLAAVKDCSAVEVYSVYRRLHFMGKMLRFGKTANVIPRMFRRGSVRFSGEIHEKLVGLESAPVCLRGTLAHYSYGSTEEYFCRFNSYTSQYARLNSDRSKYLLGVLIRPWWEFIYRFILRLGFLDGYPGYCMAVFSSLYCFVKGVKAREHQIKSRSSHSQDVA